MKYIGSPWGTIRGILNGAVGGTWKGINWGRVIAIPTSRGSIAKYRQYKAGALSSYSFSYPQFNVRHAVVNVLGYMSRKFYDSLLDVWADYLARHPGLKLGPMNAFVKTNIANFLASMPNKDQEYNAVTNAPLLTSLKVSKGDLEPVQSITSAIYTTGTGVCAVTFATGTFENGLATDNMWWAVAKKPLLASYGVNGTFEPTVYLYGMVDSTVARSVGIFNAALPAGLTAADLVCYVFCKDDAETIGFSDSKAIQVTAP